MATTVGQVKGIVQRVWRHVVQHPIWSAVVAGITILFVVGAFAGIWQITREAFFGSSSVGHTIEFSFSGSDSLYADVPTNDGDCWITSLASGRSDSWRCSSDNFIRDPCFEPIYTGNFATVICPGDPRTSTDDVALRFDREKAIAQLTEFVGQST